MSQILNTLKDLLKLLLKESDIFASNPINTQLTKSPTKHTSKWIMIRHWNSRKTQVHFNSMDGSDWGQLKLNPSLLDGISYKSHSHTQHSKHK